MTVSIIRADARYSTRRPLDHHRPTTYRGGVGSPAPGGVKRNQRYDSRAAHRSAKGVGIARSDRRPGDRSQAPTSRRPRHPVQGRPPTAGGGSGRSPRIEARRSSDSNPADRPWVRIRPERASIHRLTAALTRRAAAPTPAERRRHLVVTGVTATWGGLIRGLTPATQTRRPLTDNPPPQNSDHHPPTNTRRGWSSGRSYRRQGREFGPHQQTTPVRADLSGLRYTACGRRLHPAECEAPAEGVGIGCAGTADLGFPIRGLAPATQPAGPWTTQPGGDEARTAHPPWGSGRSPRIS